jgi:hypothetical protein
MNATAPLRSHPQTLLKTAYVVHWCAIAGIVATSICAGYSRNNKELIVLSGYLGSITLVLIIWSMSLAIRARFQGEHTRWWAVVVFYGSLELNAILIGTYLYAQNGTHHASIVDWVVASGLPLFVLFFTCVGWITYRISCNIVDWRSPDLDDAEKFIKSLWYMAALTAVSILVVLPVPLFLYCAVPPQSNPDTDLHVERPSDVRWQSWVADNMPDFVRDTSLSATGVLSYWNQRTYKGEILLKGRCSLNALELNVDKAELYSKYDGNSLQSFAFAGLRRCYPDAAFNIARRHSRNEFNPKYSDENFRWACGELFASKALDQEIYRSISNLQSDTCFKSGLFHGLAQKSRITFAADIDAFVEHAFVEENIWINYPSRPKDILITGGLVDSTLSTQAILLSPDIFVRQWSDLLSDPNRPKLREIVCASLFHIDDYTLSFKTLEHAFDISNSEVKRLLLCHNAEFIPSNMRYVSSRQSEALNQWVWWLIRQMNDTDVVIRRAVIVRLIEAVDCRTVSPVAPFTETRIGPCSEWVKHWNEVNIIPESTVEFHDRRDVLDYATQWLKSRGAD